MRGRGASQIQLSQPGAVDIVKSMDRLLLFDVDATLLLTGGAGMRAMKRTTLELFGERFDWDGIESWGGLDPVLFAEAARSSAIEVTAAEHDAFRDRYVEILAQELRARAHDVQAMPGVHQMLDLVRVRPDLVPGLLTGNYPGAAALKLGAIGVDIAWFPIAVFGDEADSRPALGALALRKYADAYGGPLSPERVVVIGDTPKDIRCARENGFLAFGVGTGRFTADDLLAAGAHAAVKDLSNPADFLEWLS